jgi:hypothetical protein
VSDRASWQGDDGDDLLRRFDSEHWAAFLEMAETWELFGKLQEQSRRLKGILKTKMPEAVLRIENAVRVLERPT